MGFPLDENSKSLVKKHLSLKSYNRLKKLSTSSGFTLEKAIQSGVANPDSSIGIYAGDAESYTLFSDIFSAVIEEYHGYGKEQLHCSDFSAVALLDPDPEKKYIQSTRVRVARNIEKYAFTSHIGLGERRRLEHEFVAALDRLPQPFAGTYHSFECETDESLLFKKGDRFQDAAGINSDFPLCRGIFYSQDRRLRIWLHEEDHLRLISQEVSSDLSGVFNHLGTALTTLQKNLSFACDRRYGYLTTCPTNLGTSMRAGVHIRLRKLDNNRALLNKIVEKNQLQLRGTGGENTAVENSVFDISNKRRLGLSEVDIITSLHRGLMEIIDAEKNV